MKQFLTSVLSFTMIFSLTTCLAQNKLSQALSKPSGVTKLKIEYTPIANLPPAIGTLADLKTLYLFKNGLDSLPVEIGNLENLRFLVIGKNSLTYLPDEIGNLTRLRELNVAYCGPMVRIPETISNCKSLEYIYVDKSILLPYSINNVNPRLQVLIKERGVLN